MRMTIYVEDCTTREIDEYVIDRNQLNLESCCDEVVSMMRDILLAMGYHNNSISDSFRSLADEISPDDK